MEAPRPPWGAAALAGSAAFLLYVVTLAPTTAFWDTSEYIATAHILGIPHPPGNPLFVVLAKVWTLLLAPLGLSVAVRVNLFAAATTAGAVFFFYLVAHRIAAGLLGDERLARVGAAASALVGATAFTVWNQANVNEKVYTLSMLVVAAVSWLGLRWRDRVDEPGSARLLLVALFLIVLGSTNHLMSVLPAPALLLLVLLTRPSVVVRPQVAARAVAIVAVGLSFNFFLPIRAAQDPVINEGDPTCETVAGAVAAVYTNGNRGCPALAASLQREQYQKPPFWSERMAPFGHQMLNFWQYFGWQWARSADPSEQPGTARLPFNLLFVGLGLAGLWGAFRVDRVYAAYLTALAGTLTVALVYYLNFRYGYSLAPEITEVELHEVRERDYFFVAGFLLWGVLAGIGITWAWAVLRSVSKSPRAALVTSPVLLAALFPVVLNWPWASRAGDWAAYDWAYDLLMSVEPYAVLFTNGDNDTFPLWYMQEVEGLRPDVTVIVGQYLHTDWYPRQLQQLTSPERQRRFDPSQGAGVYEDRPAPRSPILSTDPDSMDRIGGGRLDRDATMPLPGLAVTYPAGMYLNREQQLVLTILRDSLDERPVYFSASGGVMAQLGLDRWGVREGLVTRLALRPLGESSLEGVVQGSPEYGGEFYDLDRTLTLYDEVYRYRGIRERAIWQDRATLNVPIAFYVMALQISDALVQAGRADPALMQRLDEDALAFRSVSLGGPRGTPGA